MKQISYAQCKHISGRGVIVVVGGAFLLGVVGGYIAQKTKAFLSR